MPLRLPKATQISLLLLLVLLLGGEVELHVAIGVPDPVDRIKSVLPGVVDVG